MADPKWEVKCVESWGQAEALAASGWELVTVLQGGDWTKYYFKRLMK